MLKNKSWNSTIAFQILTFCVVVIGIKLLLNLPAHSAQNLKFYVMVYDDGQVIVTGTGQPRIIDRTGEVWPGEWIEPKPGTVAVLLRGPAIDPLSLPDGIRTLVEMTGVSYEESSQSQNILALFIPKEKLSPAAIRKGDDEIQMRSFRALYPRDSKVADLEPVFAWEGGSDWFEVRLYQRGLDGWIWKQQISNRRQTKPPAGTPLELSQVYTWEVRDLRNRENVDLASFETPTLAEQERLKEAVRKIRADYRNSSSSKFNCELAIAGFYRTKGYLYNAIRTVETIPLKFQQGEIVKILLQELIR
ncbi:MAG: hypothetical protein KAV87_21195 [Desulfobacteraceae bacterium]|nr:hypothetical protein [Desulfobacteraceae bacterium]